MEYRGYSVSDGVTNPTKINSDANRVMDYLLERGIQPQQIIILGRSIGCAVALAALKQSHSIFCMALLSPFLSLKKIAK